MIAASAARSIGRAQLAPRASLVLISFLLLLSGALLASCGHRSESAVIKLPSEPIAAPQSQWAVVTSEFLRIRDSPSLSATALLTLLRGYEVEIVDRSPKPEAVGDQTDYWYYINYLGLRGWVFGSYLAIYDSKARADEAVKELH